jgi:hypothetical protein
MRTADKMNTGRKYISAYGTARRLDIDPRTLLNLVNGKVVKPSARVGDRIVFAEDQLAELRSVVEANIRRQRV